MRSCLREDSISHADRTSNKLLYFTVRYKQCYIHPQLMLCGVLGYSVTRYAYGVFTQVLVHGVKVYKKVDMCLHSF